MSAKTKAKGNVMIAAGSTLWQRCRVCRKTTKHYFDGLVFRCVDCEERELERPEAAREANR